MKKKTDEILVGCLKEMESLMAIMNERLTQYEGPIDAFIVEYWPIFHTNKITYKIWNGDTHVLPLGGCSWRGTQLTTRELMEVVERRMILKRKFN